MTDAKARRSKPGPMVAATAGCGRWLGCSTPNLPADSGTKRVVDRLLPRSGWPFSLYFLGVAALLSLADQLPTRSGLAVRGGSSACRRRVVQPQLLALPARPLCRHRRGMARAPASRPGRSGARPQPDRRRRRTRLPRNPPRRGGVRGGLVRLPPQPRHRARHRPGITPSK